MKALINVQKVPNPFVMVFHVNRVICGTRIQRFERPLRERSEKYLAEVGKTGSEVVRKIMRLPGVTEISIQPYELQVVISEAHSWESLEPSVLNVLFHEVFGDRNDVEIVRSRMSA